MLGAVKASPGEAQHSPFPHRQAAARRLILDLCCPMCSPWPNVPMEFLRIRVWIEMSTKERTYIGSQRCNEQLKQLFNNCLGSGIVALWIKLLLSTLADYIRVWVQVQATPLLIQLLVDTPGKTVEDGPVHGPLLPM